MSLTTGINPSHQMMLHGRDLPWLLEHWAERIPDKPFLIWEPFEGEAQQWTYADIQHESKTLAAALYRRGIQPGDRVLIHLDNSPEFIISWFACAHLGAIAVSTNTRSVARDMEYFAEHAGVICAITQPGFASLVHGSAPAIQFMVVTDNNAGTPVELPDIPHVPFSDLLVELGECPQRPVDPMADLGIQYTSGTTSRPKAVLWTHANVIWGAQVNASHMKLRHEDITLITMPLFHTNAQSYSLLGSLWVGGTIVLQPKFSASRFWAVSLKHQVTWCSMVYFCVNALLKQPIPEEHTYRFWGLGVHVPEIDQHFKLTTLGWWGMTETVTHGIVGDLEHPGAPLTMGRAAAEYAIRICHPDGTRIQPGEQGRLSIRGVRGITLFKEYYKNPEATANSFNDDGWLDTGDIVAMDVAGNLFFKDRDKDMLKVGGENVAASEVEAVILETGWVSECAVVGQKHAMLDEVPVALPQKQQADKVSKAAVGLGKINALYRLEKVIKDLSPREKYEQRQKIALPLLDDLKRWLDSNLGAVPKGSLTYTAIYYIRNQWSKLIRYCEDGRLNISNAGAENAIRPFAVGRRRWLFCDTPKGAHASAVHYSLVETCKANGLSPDEYYREILPQLPYADTVEKVEALLPWNVKATLEKNRAQGREG